MILVAKYNCNWWPVTLLDNFSYAGVIAALGALGFFLGNLVLNFGLWQLIVAPIIGAGLGWLCGVWVLKERRLPASATLDQMKSAMKRDGVLK
jgi:predicted small integral membrane protein